MLDTKKIKNIFCNSYTEINDNHSKAIDVFHRYLNNHNESSSVLVHFDTHSDLLVNSSIDFLYLGNWVNFAISKFGIKEFYWIIPNYVLSNDKYRKIFEKRQSYVLNKFFCGFDDKGLSLENINESEFLFNLKNSEIITKGRITHINEKCSEFKLPSCENWIKNVRPLKIYIISAKNLGILKNKKFYLSIDADYFCNSGYDTLENIGNLNILKSELYDEFDLFINEMYKVGLMPICTSLSTSPNYFPEKFRDEIYMFFFKIKELSKN